MAPLLGGGAPGGGATLSGAALPGQEARCPRRRLSNCAASGPCAPAPPHGPFNAKQGTALCKLPAQGSNLTGGGF